MADWTPPNDAVEVKDTSWKPPEGAVEVKPKQAEQPSLMSPVTQGIQGTKEAVTDFGKAAAVSAAQPVAGVAQLAEQAVTGGDKSSGAAIRWMDNVLSQAKQRSPLASFTGQVAGTIAPNLLTGGGSAAPTMLRATAMGAGFGAAQPTQTGLSQGEFFKEKAGQAAEGAAVGGATKAVGALGGSVFGKYVEPSTPQTEARIAANQRGFETNARMASRYNPTEIDTNPKNIDNMTRRVTAEAGAETDRVSDAWMADRYKALGNQYSDIFRGKQFNVDTQGINSTLKDFVALEAQLPATVRDTRVLKTATEFLNAKGTVATDGEALHTMYKRLGDMAYGRDASPELKQVAGELRSQLKMTIKGQLGEQELAKFEDINKKYQALNAIKESGARDNRTEKISGVRLGDWIGKQDRPTSYGSDELRSLGTIGQKLGLGSDKQYQREGIAAMNTKAGVVKELAAALIPYKERMQQQYVKGKKPDMTSDTTVALMAALDAIRERETK